MLKKTLIFLSVVVGIYLSFYMYYQVVDPYTGKALAKSFLSSVTDQRFEKAAAYMQFDSDRNGQQEQVHEWAARMVTLKQQGIYVHSFKDVHVSKDDAAVLGTAKITLYHNGEYQEHMVALNFHKQGLRNKLHAIMPINSPAVDDPSARWFSAMTQ